MSPTRIEQLTAPELLADLKSVDLDEVRSRRAACQEAELALSYMRRMAQGRLDIVLAERDRRSGGGEGGDLASLIQQLPSILSEHRATGGFARPDSITSPDDADQLIKELEGEIDDIVSADRLASLPDLDDAGLAAIIDQLADLERRVSSERQTLHARLDALQEEIVRRYRTGEATVEGLLNPES